MCYSVSEIVSGLAFVMNLLGDHFINNTVFKNYFILAIN